jgi:hypothetical protein
MSDATLNARADVKDSVQASIMKCERCGRRCLVIQETAYEFSMECRATVISERRLHDGVTARRDWPRISRKIQRATFTLP